MSSRSSCIGLRHEDDRDLARQAKVSASSVRGSIGATKPHSAYRLERDVAILFPVEPAMQGLELLVDASGDTRLAVELWDTGRPENYVPCTKVAEAEAAISKGEAQWISLPLAWAPDTPQNAFVIIRGNPEISLYRAAEPLTGVLAFEKGAVPNASADLEDHDENQPVVAWSMKSLVRQPFCFKVLGTTAAYSPAKAVGGYKRPFGGPNLWASDPIGPEHEAWLQLTWESEITLQEVRLTWNDDVNEDLINLHHHRTPFEIIPELVKSYRIEACIGGEWGMIASVKDNRRRSNRIALNERISTDALRLVIEQTNGAPAAELVEIRVY
ncbi:hypothetical protein [Paenibacillus sp. AR247]|uniref:hypothetical protein n=1 Tax=Paenibacillus sp. AR247 TaxID=1631599 RepID=UPI000CFA6053|nr:hypothetical protein [Paenibacillus sp. AR247]PQP89021.1 hypothetical protein CPT76_12505 [Paenibacillus sp. AR247]